MNSLAKTQRGASAIVVLIVLAILGAGVFVGLQYLPQYMEAGAVDSILGNIEKAHEETPFRNTREIETRINNQLNINERENLSDSFTVTQEGQGYRITVSYERELNLLYEKKPMAYEKTLTLQ